MLMCRHCNPHTAPSGAPSVVISTTRGTGADWHWLVITTQPAPAVGGKKCVGVFLAVGSAHHADCSTRVVHRVSTARSLANCTRITRREHRRITSLISARTVVLARAHVANKASNEVRKYLL